MHDRKTFGLLILVTLLTSATLAKAGDIQAAIDAAAPGDIVLVPAGTYEESIVLKDDIVLVGEGADSTIIDGGGAGTVVLGGRNSLIIGFTVRNGKTGIANSTNAIGVFECNITDIEKHCILIRSGFGVVGHNLIQGNSKSTGILSQNSNPYVFDNVIADHLTGFWTQGRFQPSLIGNVFSGNQIAVRLDGGGSVHLEGNSFHGNNKDILGQSLGDTDVILGAAPAKAVPYTGGTVDEYRALYARVSADSLADHPVVIYTLEKLIGDFGMAVLNSWATFNIAASTEDTQVIAYDAVDLATADLLNVEYKNSTRPLLSVVNPDLKDVDPERFALDTIFRHAPSYYVDTDGRLVFDRLTNITRIEVLVPEGYLPVSTSHAASQDWAGNRVVVKITDVGHTRVRIVMEPIAGE